MSTRRDKSSKILRRRDKTTLPRKTRRLKNYWRLLRKFKMHETKERLRMTYVENKSKNSKKLWKQRRRP